MKGAHNINPIITLQQSELHLHAGIEIEEVTATVASIQTIMASHDALVPNGKTLRLLAAEAHHSEPNPPAVVGPANAGYERNFIPVKSTFGFDCALQDLWTIQSPHRLRESLPGASVLYPALLLQTSRTSI